MNRSGLIRILYITYILALIGCGGAKEEKLEVKEKPSDTTRIPVVPPVKTLSYDTLLIDRNKINEQDTFNFYYWRSTVKGVPDSAVTAINQSVNAFLFREMRPIVPNETPGSLSELVNTLALRVDGAGSQATPWQCRAGARIIYANPEVLTFRCFFNYNKGDEIPVNTIRYISFSPLTGKVLTPNRVLADMNKVNKIAERKFRAQKKLSDRADLEDAGFRFENNRFSLGNNYGITDEGLVFYFNPGEIASYSLGSTEIRISYNELDSLYTYPDDTLPEL
jgi:hypothetical protein